MIRPINKVLICRRREKELRLYERSLIRKRFTGLRTYPIAIGAAGYETPLGLYYVATKDRRPGYTYPHSDWVRDDLKGEWFPFGHPLNPIAGRWMGLADGVGIHGTYDEASIGKEASHGCLRMRADDIRELFPLVPKGTPCFID